MTIIKEMKYYPHILRIYILINIIVKGMQMTDNTVLSIGSDITGKYPTEIAPFAYSENRDIKELYISESVKKIGAHAFYNCRSIYRLTLKNAAVDIGDGAFKNCERLREILIYYENGGNLKSLKSILADIHTEVKVHIFYGDGEASLIFPYGIDNYEENTPARIITEISEGSGSLYRESISAGEINYRDYDKTFILGMNVDLYKAGIRIAVERLLYPYRLSEQAEIKYKDFVIENICKAVIMLAESGRSSDIERLTDICITDKTKLWKITDIMREKGYTDIQSLLLDKYNRLYGREKKKYEF